MGKGDKKTRRGKIILGTYGVRRRRKAEDKKSDTGVPESSKKEGKTAAKEAAEPKVVRHTRVKEAKEEKISKTATKASEPRPVSGKKAIDEKKAAKGEPAEAKPVKAKKA